MNIHVLQWNSSGTKSNPLEKVASNELFGEELIALFLDMALQTPSQGAAQVF